MSCFLIDRSVGYSWFHSDSRVQFDSSVVSKLMNDAQAIIKRENFAKFDIERVDREKTSRAINIVPPTEV